jgi:5,6,7,8-tetrahydromethanopterin hydro-lyase
MDEPHDRADAPQPGMAQRGSHVVQIGEGFAGDGVNAAHINSMLGAKDGPVGIAWATALATPRAGHTPFVVVARPNVPVKPMTLFVNKATVEVSNEPHARLTWGAAQAGIAAGVIAAYGKGMLHESEADDLVLVTAVWVNPAADDEEAVYANNADAALAAISAGRLGAPSLGTLFDVREPENPYFRA